MIVGQGPIALAIGAGGGCLDIFSLIYLFSFLSPSLWESARYRLKYCLKEPLNPKQPTNQPNQYVKENYSKLSPQICSYGIFFQGTQEQFETAPAGKRAHQGSSH